MKNVYFFGNNQTEGKKELKEILGGKGANLAEMANLKIPVPPGFTITTKTCKNYIENDKKLSEETIKEIVQNIQKLEKAMNKKFGDTDNPLLLSVRSGAAVSMPGMMDTILNLGLNDEIVKGLAKKSNNEQFAWDSYRRFIQMFGNVVLNIPSKKFEKILENIKEEKNIEFDKDLKVDSLKKIVELYKQIIFDETGIGFPSDVKEQLILSVKAVFDSWNNKRAIKYREINNIKGLIGTAVNVQTMVFGNMGDDSATGVCFSRNPATGENLFYGEFLMNAQGEDVVAGIRTPQPIDKLKEEMPDCFHELISISKKLESHYCDMQDMEFTIENGTL